MSKSRHHRPDRPERSVVVSSASSGPPPRDSGTAPSYPAASAPAQPTRFGIPGVAIVPSDLLAQIHRQWIWFMVLAGLCLVLAVSSMAGWVLYIRANNALADAGKDNVSLQKAEAALTAAEKRTTDVDTNAQARVMAAEQAHREADQKRENAELALKNAEQKRDLAERAKETAEAKQKTAEEAKLEAEAKASGAEQSRALAESKATHAQQLLATAQDNYRRLQMDTAVVRREMQTAREGERRAIQKLQDVLGDAIFAERKAAAPAAAVPTAAAPAAAAPTASPPAAPEAVASVQTPPAAAPAPTIRVSRPTPMTQPALAEANTATEAPIKPPTPLDHLQRPAETPDPAIEAASPEQLLPWGEAMIVADYPERGAMLIRKAIEKGAQGAAYQKALGWALLRSGQPDAGKQALAAALAGFEDWAATSAQATPDHWAAAFLLGRVKEDDFIRRWSRDDKFEDRLSCLPWFYAGQQREIEGRRDEAISAYQVCVELGQSPGAYPIWHWAQQRLRDLEKAPATQPGTGLGALNNRQ